MKKILILLILLISMASQATVYYVSATGSDAANGTTTGSAWQTLSKVNSSTFAAGDQILFKKGDSFYGSFTIAQSGTYSNRITFGAYGTGANPIVTGFTTVSEWTDKGSNIWESTNEVSTLATCNMVSINGVNTPMGRYPNSNATWGGYFPFQSHVGNPSTSLTSSSLTGTPDWTGAEVAIRSNAYYIERRTITSQSGGTLNFSALVWQLMNGFGFFIQNDIRTLDQQNEWYYNPSTKKLSIYSISQPNNVKVASIGTLLTENGSYITIDGIDFIGANQYMIYSNTGNKTYVTVQNCNFSYSGESMVNFRFDRSIVDNCTFTESQNTAINFGSNANYCTISNCVITNIGTIKGMGINGYYSGIMASVTKGLNIDYNRIINTGFNPMSIRGDSVFIRHNYVDTFNSLLMDGGGIYVAAASEPNGCEISDNIVINGVGALTGTTGTENQVIGIYIDVLSQHYNIYRNTIANVPSGIMVSGIYAVKIEGNTTYNCPIGLTMNTGSGGHAPIEGRGNTVKNNILVCNQVATHWWAVKYNTYGYATNDSFPKIADFSDNVYAKPLNDYNLLHSWEASIQMSNTMTNGALTLEQWKTFSGKDAGSIKSPKAITSTSELALVYNDTKNAKVVTAPYAAIDMFGTQYDPYITLQPFTSKVLIQNAGSPTLPTVTSASVSPQYVGSGGQVTFTATASEGTIKWWTASIGGTEITNLSPIITQSTTYYAEAISSTGYPSAARTAVTATVLSSGKNAYRVNGHNWVVGGKIWVQ